jgi:hypothetical protein
MEMMHDTRIIPLDGRAHLTSGIGQMLGDSRGRWEGDTLVAATTNFNEFACHEGNASAMIGTLRGARLQEQAVAAKPAERSK